MTYHHDAITTSSRRHHDVLPRPARGEGKEIKENTKGNALPNASLFSLPLPTQKGRKMDYRNLAEEELKLRIAEQFFPTYDCAHRIGKIDFAVTLHNPQPTTHNPQPTTHNPQPSGDATMLQSLLWAEAKRGTITDIYKPLVQLVLTIGRARTFDTYLPPPFLGVFDAEKIVFLPYKEIMPFFTLNDFNWNVTPSDESTREFGLLYEAIRASLALRARGPCGRQAGQGEDHTDAVPVVRTQRDASGAKGARPVRATSGQRRIGQARRCRELRV